MEEELTPSIRYLLSQRSVISPDFRVWNIVNRSYQEYCDWIVQSFSLNAIATVTNSACGDNGSIIMDVTGYNTKSYKWSSGETTKKDWSIFPGVPIR
ncbi:MAG: hypothetical protein U0T81_13440 [Saprospiraceae bacterium]